MLYAWLISCILITNPKPGIRSLPLGTSGDFISNLASVFVSILGLSITCVVVVSFTCTVATEVVTVSGVVCNAVSSCAITGSVWINGAVVACAIGLFGFSGDIGLTGDSTFVGFVIDFTHVFET